MKTLQRLTLGVCLFISMLLLSAKSEAQLKAVFSASNTSVGCPPQTVYFTDASQGNPISWSWKFGDNTSSNIASPNHVYTTSGKFTVTLVVTDASNQTASTQTVITVSGPTVQYSKIMDTTCAAINVKFTPKGTGINPLTYSWDFGDGKTSSSITPGVTHSYKGGSSYLVNLTVKDNYGCSVKVADTLTFGSVAPVLPTSPNTLAATRECLDAFGWTNYYNDNNTPDIKDDILLLSLQKNGNSIGTVGDGTFQVKVAATAEAGSNKSLLLTSPVITNTSGYYVMNRYWVVQPTTEPVSPVGVRFYFNDQDVNDINGSFPNKDATFDQLIFYKTKNGNPDPTTNLTGATDIISIFNGDHADETHWLYSYNGSGSHGAEFLVSSFSGGGAGVTVNRQTLPLKVLSFTGKAENGGVKLNWLVASEINVERFELEASADGKAFTFIGKVTAKGAVDLINEYTFNDLKVSTEKATFYKLVSVDKDGKKSYSEIIRVSLPVVSNAISLYPVPANSYVTVSSKSLINKSCTVDVYNSIGVKVLKVNKTSPGNSFEVNTSALPSGRYRMIIFNNNDKIGDASFIVVR